MIARRPFPLILVVVVLTLTAACISSMDVRKFEANSPTTAPAKSRSILFAKVASGMPAGEQIGTVAHGYLCQNDGVIRWTQGTYAETAGMIARAFQAEAGKAGYKVMRKEGESLFEGPSPWDADVLIAAVVKDVKLNTCVAGFGRALTSTGEASVEIEWHVFEVRSRRIVASVMTGGSAKTRRQPEGGVKAISEAVASAARNVLAREQFVHALAVEQKSATAEPELTPLVVDVVALGDETASAPDVIEGVQRSVVSIKTEGGLGSGFIVSSPGLVVTNAHVVEQAPRVKVILATGREVSATVLRRNAVTDVALLQLEEGVYPAAPLGGSVSLKPGAPVFAVGSPLGHKGTVTRGIVSAVRVEEDRRVIQSDVTVHAGSSGGPLLDERGRVIGITRSGKTTLFGTIGVGLNDFIPIEEAWRGLRVRTQVVDPSPSALPQR